MLTLPWPPKELSPNKRLHWARTAAIRARYREACFFLTKEARLRVDWEGPIHLWLDFYPPDRRHRDDDNMISSFKAGRDGLAEALGINDRRFQIHPRVIDQVGGMVKVRLTKEIERERSD